MGWELGATYFSLPYAWMITGISKGFGQCPIAPVYQTSIKKHYSGGLSLSYQPLIDNIGGRRGANPKWKGAFGQNPEKMDNRMAQTY